MEITRTSGKRANAGHAELVTAGGNQTTVRNSWKTLAIVVLGLVLTVPELAQAQYVLTKIDEPPGATNMAPNGNSTHERAHFCHSANGTHAFGFTLRANAPEGQKGFPIS
jgi:hypothetical protein